MTDDAKRNVANARSSRLSENIHWITVAVVVVLLILSFFGHIDPHGRVIGHFGDTAPWGSSSTCLPVHS